VAGEQIERRLAAILMADVAGYSRLIGIDDEGTLAQLNAHHAELIEPKIKQHRGRIVRTTGDGLLVLFVSAVDALHCAVEIQRAMAERNAQIPPDRQIKFRIGVNVGDIVEGASIHGDGINVAARLEELAEAGGICVSSRVQEDARGSLVKLGVAFEDIGERQLKNIDHVVHVYRVLLDHATTTAKAKQAHVLPDKPSIAVLPFANLSSHPEQEYVVDGIVEDIITELSRFSELFVSARNSSFQYKGKAVDVRQVGRELGVRYLLEGSARKGEDRIRISAQLIDVATGAHRWAEHYDRTLEDIFAVQDDVVRTIVAILAAHVRQAETERLRAKPPNSWQAYDCYLQAVQALAAFSSTLNEAHIEEARRLLQQSLAIDPNYARSYAGLAGTDVSAWHDPTAEDFLKPAVLDRAHDFARKAVQLDRNLPLAHAALGWVLVYKHQHDASIAAFEKSVSLNPNYVDWRFGVALIRAGDAKRAIEVVHAYMRLDPFYVPFASFVLGYAHLMLKQYPQALSLLRDYVAQAPSARGRVLLAATLAGMGHLEEARAEVAEAVRLKPKYSISSFREFVSFKYPQDDNHFFDGLRKAGLPE
jgi:TolB-like protein/class 3 adenylate cyclase/tetratricopeptide (TPR) repeat protein